MASLAKKQKRNPLLAVPTTDGSGTRLSAGQIAVNQANVLNPPAGARALPGQAGLPYTNPNQMVNKPGKLPSQAAGSPYNAGAGSRGNQAMPTNLNDLIAWQLRENQSTKFDTTNRIDALNRQLGAVGAGLQPSDETALNQASSRINAASNMASDQAAFQAAEAGQAGGSGAASASAQVERQRLAALGQAAGDFAKNRLSEQLQIQGLRLGALSNQVIPNFQPMDLTGLGGLMVAQGRGGEVNAGGVRLNVGGGLGGTPRSPAQPQAQGGFNASLYGPNMPPVSANEFEAMRQGRYRTTMANDDPRLKGLVQEIAGRRPAQSNGQSTYAQTSMGQPWVTPEQSFIYGSSNPGYGTAGAQINPQLVSNGGRSKVDNMDTLGKPPPKAEPAKGQAPFQNQSPVLPAGANPLDKKQFDPNTGAEMTEASRSLASYSPASQKAGERARLLPSIRQAVAMLNSLSGSSVMRPA